MPATADSPTPRRTGLWVLVWQNAVVANAAALLLGCGGLRTPCTAVNLWATAGLLLWPAMRWLARRGAGPRITLQRHADRHIHDGPVVRTAFVALVSVLSMAAVTAIVVPLLIAAMFMVMQITTSALPTGVRIAPWAVALAQGLLTLALIGTVRSAQAPWARTAQRTLRAIAWLPPIAWTALLAFSCLWTPTAWFGRDPMFEPIARLDHGWRSYVVVRVNMAAFRPYYIEVMAVTPVVPGLLGYWRMLHRERASDAALKIVDAGTLVVTFNPQDRQPDEVCIPLR